MKWFSNLFASAGEKAQLTREILFLQGQLEHERTRNDLLEKQILTERRAKDKFVNTFCDQISKQQGLPMVFKEKEPAKDVTIPPDPVLEASIKEAAEVMREADELIGEARPLEAYIAKIRENPERFITWRPQ